MEFICPVQHVVHVGSLYNGIHTALLNFLAHGVRHPKTSVLCIDDRFGLAEEIRELGVTANVLPLWRCVLPWRGSGRCEAQLTHGWGHLGNLSAGLQKTRNGAPVLWSLHDIPAGQRLSVKFVSFLSRPFSGTVPSRVICHTEASRQAYASSGYSEDLMVQIPYGVPVDFFKFSMTDADRFRASLGISPDSVILGMAARFAPEKNFDTFVRAASKIVASGFDCEFVLTGCNVVRDNPKISRMLAASGVSDRFHLLGYVDRNLMPSFFSACDIVTLTSDGVESFGFAICEALSCETLCVLPEIGSVPTSFNRSKSPVFDPRDANKLAACWQELLTLDPEELKTRKKLGRQLVIEEFGVQSYCSKINELYRIVLAETGSQ